MVLKLFSRHRATASRDYPRSEITDAQFVPISPISVGTPASTYSHESSSTFMVNNVQSVEEIDDTRLNPSASGRQQILQDEQQRKNAVIREEVAFRKQKREQLRIVHQREQAIEDERQSQLKRYASAASIQRLRRLIQDKYRLDVQIWDKRNALKADRHIIRTEYLMKSDMILQEIYDTVDKWTDDLFDDPEERQLAKKIKEGIIQRRDKHPIWVSQPPWDRPEADMEL